MDEALVEQCFEAQRRFFAMPLEKKLLIKADKNNRGYTPLEEERLDPEGRQMWHAKLSCAMQSSFPVGHPSASIGTSGSSQGDSHSGLYFCRDVPADSEEAKLPLHGPNQWCIWRGWFGPQQSTLPSN